MNKQQRKDLAKLEKKLEPFKDEGALSALSKEDKDAVDDELSDIRQELESVVSEEQEKYDNMPEGLQNGDKGEELSDVIQTLQGGVDALDAVDGADLKEEDWADRISSAANEAAEAMLGV